MEFDFGNAGDPFIDVITEICNGSIFNLVNLGEISGHATYAGRQLAANSRTIDFVEPLVLNLKHGEQLILTVRQYLSVETADHMQAHRDRGIAIDFANVMVPFKVLSPVGFSVETFFWSGPRFTIDDTVRV